MWKVRPIACYFFGLACFGWAIVMTIAAIDLGHRLDTYHRPYKEKYASLSDVDLLFRVEGAYDDLERYIDASTKVGDWNYPEIYKMTVDMGSYIEEMKRRKTDIVVITPTERDRLIVESEIYKEQHEPYF